MIYQKYALKCKVKSTLYMLYEFDKILNDLKYNSMHWEEENENIWHLAVSTIMPKHWFFSEAAYSAYKNEVIQY